MKRLAPGSIMLFALVAAAAATGVAAQTAAPSDGTASAGPPVVASPDTAAPDATTKKPKTEPANAPLSSLAKKLEDKGVFLRSVLIDQYADNPTGGVSQGHTNVGQFNIGADIDLDKAWGLSGGSFHFTVYRDYGESLNHNVTGTFTKQQYIYKNEFPQWQACSPTSKSCSTISWTFLLAGSAPRRITDTYRPTASSSRARFAASRASSSPKLASACCRRPLGAPTSLIS
jgi:carbohydrate-selective porin OprB